MDLYCDPSVHFHQKLRQPRMNMSQKEKIEALRKGKTGNQILRILDSLHGIKITTISTTTEAIPDPGYIITWDGRQVAF